MKNIKYWILIFALNFNSVFAFNYTETDKEMFYDAFLDGYFTEIAKSINQMNIEQSKKDKLVETIKKQTNKQELINSSWDCIQKYPIQQIVPASVICTSTWTQKQALENKKIFDSIK